MEMGTNSMGIVPTYDLADRERGYGYGYDGYGFGGGWIWMILLFALFGGNGFGGWGRGTGTFTDFLTNEFVYTNLNSTLNNNFQTLTQSGQATRELIGQTARQIDNGICQLGYQGLQNTNILERQLCDNRFDTQMGFKELSSQMADCCCDLKQINLENRYISAQQTCDIIRAGEANTQRILDYLTNNKIEQLRTDLQSANLALQNNAQTRTLIDSLRPCPTPAYVVPNPCTGYYGFGGYGFNGCNPCCGGLV